MADISPRAVGDAVVRASVATVVTVLGYILFMGALIAILVQWLDRTLEIEALGRIDFAHAASVVIPAADTTASSALDADARSVKTLMMMGAALAPDLVGASIRQLSYAFPEGVLLGLVRPKGDGFAALLNPPDTLLVEPGDPVVVLATRYSESDARTILAYLLLRQLTVETAGPHVFMELIDPDNSHLFENRLENEHTEIVVTSRIVSHMLARVALRRELRCVFDELFSSGGCYISFRRIADYDLAPGHYVFADLQKAVDERGDIAIGLRWHQRWRDSDRGILLNPGSDEQLDLADLDDLVVLSTSDF